MTRFVNRIAGVFSEADRTVVQSKGVGVRSRFVIEGGFRQTLFFVDDYEHHAASPDRARRSIGVALARANQSIRILV